MSPEKASKRIILERVAWVDRMVEGIQSLPLDSYDRFIADRRNVWAAESCLRRGLEALLDIGRHILAKIFAVGVSEYKEVAKRLGENSVLSKDEVVLLKTLASYRNRLVHFYHEIIEEELYKICKNELNDILRIKSAYLRWLKGHPDMLDETL